jgi:hypothetical protein
MLSDLSLMDLHIDALFCHDDRGRMLRVNDPDGRPAPRLFLGRTTSGNRWRVRHDLPDLLAGELERLLRAEPIATDLSVPPATLDRMRALLNAQAPVGSISAGPAWRFPDDIPPPDGVTVVTSANAGVLQPHFGWLVEELPHRQPCAAVIRDGAAVSVCFSSRDTTLAREAGVDTARAFRRRGYAAAVVAAWARAVRQTGRVPLYSTSWDNLASQGVARRLGLLLYGEDLSIS